MRKIIFFILLALAPSLGVAQEKPLPPKKMTLEQCYQYTLKQSERLGISVEAINEAAARFTKILGEALPHIAINAQEFLQDDHANSSVPGSVGSVTNTLTRFSRPTVGVTIVQPLFHGLKEVYALKANKASQSSLRFQSENVERLLYRDVATSFYTIAQLEMTEKRLLKMIENDRALLKELTGRINLGKSRQSELSAQEAQMSLHEADLERTRGLKQVAYEMLAFLTGLEPQPPIEVVDPLREIHPINEYIVFSQQRQDVLAARKALDSSIDQRKVARGDFLPKIDAQATAYPYRVGYLSNVYWDATFNLEIPVLNWSNVGSLRESESKIKQAELLYLETKRQAETDVRKAYDAYQSSVIQLKKYSQAASKSEKSYREQLGDFSLGLINILQVLQSQQTWLDALRNRDIAQAQVWSDWASLQVATGVFQ